MPASLMLIKGGIMIKLVKNQGIAKEDLPEEVASDNPTSNKILTLKKYSTCFSEAASSNHLELNNAHENNSIKEDKVQGALNLMEEEIRKTMELL